RRVMISDLELRHANQDCRVSELGLVEIERAAHPAEIAGATRAGHLARRRSLMDSSSAREGAWSRTMKRKVSMDPKNLSALWKQSRSRVATGGRLGRRTFLRSGTGAAAVSIVGIGGLLELFATDQAIAAGSVVIPIVGVTREPFMDPDETPHRHTF